MRSQNALVVKAKDVEPGLFLNEFGAESGGIVESKILWQEKGIDVRTLIMGITEFPAGVRGVMHRHNIEEIYYILQGSGQVEVEGMEEPLKFEVGDTVFLKPNVKHRPSNLDPTTPLRFVYVCGIMNEAYRDNWGETFPDE